MVFVPQVNDTIILESQNPYTRLKREDAEKEPFSIGVEMEEMGREPHRGDSSRIEHLEADLVLDDGNVDPDKTIYEIHGVEVVGWLLGTKLDVTV